MNKSGNWLRTLVAAVIGGVKARKFKNWLKGLAAAAIGGAANAVVVYVVDPKTFSDWDKLGSIVLATGVLHAAMYLKKSPLW